MSQNGQKYTPWELSRLLGIKQDQLFKGEAGAVLKSIEKQHGGLDREAIDKWIKLGKPTPSSQAGRTGRMDYGPLVTREGDDIQAFAGGHIIRSEPQQSSDTITRAELDHLHAEIISMTREVFREMYRSGELSLRG